MRVLGQFQLVGSLTAFGILVSGLPRVEQARTGDPTAILAAAREALGGEKRLSAVKGFIVTGRTRQVRGDNLVPIEFEIACEMPDKYVRKDEIPAQESGPTSTGFNGSDLIQVPEPATPTPPPGRAGAPAGPPPAAQLEAMRKARVTTLKQDFVRWTLGMFAGSVSAYPVTFSYVGQAEAPQGKADVIDVKGEANFAVRLFINSETHLPIMVSWTAPARGMGPGRPGGPGGPAPVEYRIYYGDYRDVDGLQWPFRLRKATGAETTEETTFDRFRINPKIDARKFEVRK